MSLGLKRRSPTDEMDNEQHFKRQTLENANRSGDEQNANIVVQKETSKEPDVDNNSNQRSILPDNSSSEGDKARERQQRFKALQARHKESRDANRKETVAEARRLQTDPNAMTALNRKQAIASHKLLKAETEEAGEDFERKRAWDWTIEESEKWDKRMEKKDKHREDVAFQDYRSEARKVYKRQLRQLKPDMEGYEKEKAEAVQRAAESGGLEIVETEDGELVAVDKDGTFYSTADSTGFAEHRPDKAAVDKLVNELRKAEEVRLRKRRERGRNEPDEDVTHINDKNKQFNQKLARFYNKYTANIRENFERGTAI